MNKDLTLLIMAAGMGSRFGGLKQAEPMGPNGEFLVDYSIYDAISVGFTKVVFVIKEENYELFQKTVGKRIAKHIKVEYAFQKKENVPFGCNFPSNRVKPLGTAHAILAAKDLIDSNFVIINADDFYGRDAYRVIKQFFDQKQEDSNTSMYSLVGYEVSNTLTENGAVKRGVCKSEDGKLTKIIESSIEEVQGEIVATPLDGSALFTLEPNALVSMNMFGFTPSIFSYIENHFKEFFDQNQDNLEKCEYLIPDVVTNAIQDNYAEVRVLPTKAKWHGVTYLEDKEKVVLAIKDMIEKCEYKENLWN